MKREWFLILFLVLAGSVFVVCDGGTVDGDGDADVDGDTDIDGDGDSDSDGDLDCPGGCPAGQRCQGGRCVSGCSGPGDCPSPYQCCDGSCFNVTDSTEHCGACGNNCAPTGDACIGGVCSCNGAIFCTPPALCCSNGCVDLLSDNRHCGGCEQPCDGSCIEGVCELCSADPHEDEGGNTCADALSLGTLTDAGDQQTLTGNLYPDGDADCFWFTAEDLEDDICDTFHVDIRFVQNPDEQFALEVYRGSCETPECASETFGHYSWATDFLIAEGEEWRGECPCRPAGADPEGPSPTDEGVQLCTDNTAVYRFCVVRVSGDPADCGWYELIVSNSVYPTTEDPADP